MCNSIHPYGHSAQNCHCCPCSLHTRQIPHNGLAPRLHCIIRLVARVLSEETHSLARCTLQEMLDKRLNDKGKNWRHVFKALTVLDYILHAGSENVVLYFQ